MEQSLMDKLTILADSAKYDVACTSSGAMVSDSVVKPRRSLNMTVSSSARACMV